MPSQHATLGPSSASRWMQCPASISMAEKVVRQETSVHAMEGTLAHEVAELLAGQAFGLAGYEDAKLPKKWHKDYAELFGEDQAPYEDMMRHGRTYVEIIKERMTENPGSHLKLEQRLSTGIDKCWGTSDAVLFSSEHVEIIDYKYGTGVPVNAYKNAQLMLYAAGALRTYGDLLGTIKTVGMTVHQPRLSSVSTYHLDPVELQAWIDWTVRPLAEEALGDNPRFGPSESACRWCPAAGICKPRMERNLQLDFGDVVADNTMDVEDMAHVLEVAPEIRSWLDAVDKAAMDSAYKQQNKIPGWKVVRSNGRRYFTDPTAVIQTLIDNGYSAEQVASFKVKGFGELEKLLGGRDVLDFLLKDYIDKSEGKPALVPDGDKRPSISPVSSAIADFS